MLIKERNIESDLNLNILEQDSVFESSINQMVESERIQTIK
jgi:hypothetical protein